MARDDETPVVLTRAAIEAMDGTDKVHFLNPRARRRNRSLGDTTGLTGLGIHLIEVPPGADSTELHVHHHEDEAIYVLAGRAVLHLDEGTRALEPGDFAGFRAGGAAHALHNPGPDVLRVLVVGERRAHDVADYPRLGKRLFRNSGSWNLVDHDDLVDPKAGPEGTAGDK